MSSALRKREKARVLILEDERITAEGLKAILERHGYTVVDTLATGSGALETVKKKKPDLVLADIMLKGDMDGIQTAQGIRARYDIPVVFSTAHSDEAVLKRALDEEPFGYILKPYEEREVYTAVELALHKHRAETEREKAIATQLEAAREWQSTFDAISDGIYIVNLKGQILKCNRAVGRLMETSIDNVIGNFCYRLFHEKSRFPKDCLLTQVKKGKNRVTGVYRIRDRWVHVSVDPVFGDRKRLVGAIHVLTDITEKREAEELLRESEEKYRMLVENANSIILRRKPDGTITFINEYALSFFGYKADELVGNTVQDTIIPATDEQGNDLHKMARDIGHDPDSYTSNENENIRKNGTRVWISWTNRAIRGKNGKVAEILCVGNDITMQKKAADQIRRFKTISDEAPYACAIADMKGKLVYVNQSLLDMHGYGEGEILGKSIYRLYAKEDAAQVHTLYEGLVKDGSFVAVETRLRRKDDSLFPMLCNGVLIKDEQGVPLAMAATGIDITHLKEIEQERDEIHGQLLHAQKMEAVGILAGGVAHDFNNVLTAIQGYNELMGMKLDADNPLQKFCEGIQTATSQALDLTHQLLLFSRKQHVKMEALNINEVLKRLQKMLKRLIGEDISIKLKTDDAVQPVKADRGSLEQIIMNLMVNARDAMKKGGTLTICTEQVSLDGEITPENPEARKGNFVRLSVADTGTGISDEVLPHIFEPFFSTKEAGRGTGLGLAVIYGIIQQHKGWITVQSAEGKGTVFHIFFPVTGVRPKLSTPKQLVDLTLLKGNGQKVLLIEDEPNVREFSTQALKTYGYKPVVCENGMDAVNAVNRQRFDLVVSDVVLPDIDGMTLSERFREIDDSVPILLISGYIDEKSQASVIKKKKLPFLQKPFSMEAFLQTIHDLLHGT